VAIGALGADVLEYQVGVALNASNFLVHAAKGIPGQIVIELGIGPYGLPACVRVAVGTRGRKRAMWIGDLGLGRSYTGSDGGTGTGISGTAARFSARTSPGITTRITAGITSRIGAGVGTSTYAGCDTVPGRHATEHGRQPQNNSDNPAGKVHRSLRAFGLRASTAGRSGPSFCAQKPTTTRASCPMAGINISLSEP
jgi:hypothetical protein